MPESVARVMAPPAQLEEALGAGLNVAGRVVGAVIGCPEQENVQFLQLGPLETIRARQLEQTGRRLHRAQSGPVEQAAGQVGPEELGADDVDVVFEVVGDDGVEGIFQNPGEKTEDLRYRRPGLDRADSTTVQRDRRSRAVNLELTT